ncbi:hypothetical protein B0I72DRAFT_89834 [Yarrowia lipolytica]|jgi:hypothetical protein|uniref:Uncharacterized protein n=1 Tax=Yarrowia lipolytica TaxID=4952 RepID=A0A371BX32_YARLL|nr:hypothetical protein B0I71DRAFT_90226 [Yarrowia lipolytica]RDW29374.1 hypothetical protein B0I72DRAFT_89834 [Yarrowia lipolytica]RDW36563.1 hypothetical protein B0I73DRAFT_89806 [Yarrowia lipolytica]VBB88806.1 Hypothetical protein YALIH222_S05E06040G [Yarrowia lipolytica]
MKATMADDVFLTLASIMQVPDEIRTLLYTKFRARTVPLALCKTPEDFAASMKFPKPGKNVHVFSTARAELGPECLKHRASHVDKKTGDISGVQERVEPI